MAFSLRELWQKISFSDAVSGSADAAQAVFDLAEAINDQQNDSETIKKLAAKIPTLLEALNSPLGDIVNSTVPFLPIATGVIQFFIEANKKEPTIAEIIAIAVQAAYLESIREILRQEDIDLSDDISFDNLQQEITSLGDLELGDYEARRALVHFSESTIAKEFDKVLRLKLQKIRFNNEDSFPNYRINVVHKIAINTSKYIDQVIPELGDSVKRLLDWYSIGGKDKFEKYVSIDTYLEERITPLPKEKVFKEKFSFQDIYVSLKAKSLTFDGNEIDNTAWSDETIANSEIDNAEGFILEDWVKKTITNEDTKDKVIFIQAGAGRGKSVFCRMFAD